MVFDQNLVNELVKYKKGEFIPNPGEIIVTGIIFKRNVIGLKDMAVVIEDITYKTETYIITAMIADEKYLIKKYKKLR